MPQDLSGAWKSLLPHLAEQKGKRVWEAWNKCMKKRECTEKENVFTHTGWGTCTEKENVCAHTDWGRCTEIENVCAHTGSGKCTEIEKVCAHTGSRKCSEIENVCAHTGWGALSWPRPFGGWYDCGYCVVTIWLLCGYCVLSWPRPFGGWYDCVVKLGTALGAYVALLSVCKSEDASGYGLGWGGSWLMQLQVGCSRPARADWCKYVSVWAELWADWCEWVSEVCKWVSWAVSWLVPVIEWGLLVNDLLCLYPGPCIDNLTVLSVLLRSDGLDRHFENDTVITARDGIEMYGVWWYGELVVVLSLMLCSDGDLLQQHGTVQKRKKA